MVSTIYSVIISDLNDDCIEVRCSFMNSTDAFSFAREIALECCGTDDFFVYRPNGFTVYDAYKVPICIVSVEANDLFS